MTGIIMLTLFHHFRSENTHSSHEHSFSSSFLLFSVSLFSSISVELNGHICSRWFNLQLTQWYTTVVEMWMISQREKWLLQNKWNITISFLAPSDIFCTKENDENKFQWIKMWLRNISFCFERYIRWWMNFKKTIECRNQNCTLDVTISYVSVQFLICWAWCCAYEWILSQISSVLFEMKKKKKSLLHNVADFPLFASTLFIYFIPTMCPLSLTLLQLFIRLLLFSHTQLPFPAIMH